MSRLSRATQKQARRTTFSRNHRPQKPTIATHHRVSLGLSGKEAKTHGRPASCIEHVPNPYYLKPGFN